MRARAEPFIRDVSDQFSEMKNGRAVTFLTGIGGFLQEFLSVRLLGIALEYGRRAASLTSQLGGVVLRGPAWQGRRFTVAIGPGKTIVTLNGGPPLPLITPSSTPIVAAGRTLTVATRRPDLTPGTDTAVCWGA